MGFNRLHPAVILIFFLCALGLTLGCSNPLFSEISLVFALGLFLQTKKQKSLKLLGGLALFAMAVTLLNGLFNPEGSTMLFTYFGRPYTLEALVFGTNTACTFASLLLWFFLWNAYLDSEKLSFLLGRWAPATAMVATTTLSLVPTLKRRFQEALSTRKILGLAQGSNRSWKARAILWGQTTAAVGSWAFEVGLNQADSMASRGYGSKKKTSYGRFRFTPKDGVFLAVVLVLTLATAWGYGISTPVVFFPVLDFPPLTSGTGAAMGSYGLLLALPLLMNLSWSLSWHIYQSNI